jgi:hypothetical protein
MSDNGTDSVVLGKNDHVELYTQFVLKSQTMCKNLHFFRFLLASRLLTFFINPSLRFSKVFSKNKAKTG